ncbi:Gfo/Idh/MocA family protein [Alicyclobacillus sp. SO9]|uniref:Gfo/Idh/MocA family protein n=1 Tax=Alicyclobacillus sp. SO9 TaxID=2665646 RepID=UPI0018E85DA3|nr:Gfo/Idh/MocA family oxidoreductase [Alicyclobacillus sp. SO9]QQE81206.1 Gfo/Idh/MocA family oxidoreductase [Alicyclobacillus sp. SO9]
MVNVVVVGAGTMGTMHSTSFARMEGVQVVGIVDIRAEYGNKLASKIGTQAFLSLNDALTSQEVHLVDICVPTYLHRQYVEQAADANCHVICEKPIALTLSDANAMMDVCERAGVKFFVGHVLRFFPEYQKSHQLVQQGRVGDVGIVQAGRGGAFPNGWQDWYASIEKSGTLITDMMIHDFDFLRWCFGEVKRVYAKSNWGRDLNKIDHAFVTLRFKSGVIASVEGTWAYPDGFTTSLEIAGKGGIIARHSDEEAPIHTFLREDGTNTGGVAVPESPLLKGPYYLELEHFIDCIIHDTTPLVSPHDAYKALQISLSALQSIRTGIPVYIEEETL